MDATATSARSTPASSLLTIGLCFLVSLIEGFDLQSAGVAAPRLAPAFKLTPGQLGLFFSASTMGLLVGAAFGGRISDRIGRKTTLLVSVALFGLMSILTGLSPSFEVLVAARLLTGVGLGGALPNLIALVAENTSAERRGSAVAALYAGLPSGGAIASLVTLVDKDPTSWAMIFIIGGVAPILVIPVLWVWLPDSRTLVERGQVAVKSVGVALFGEGRAVSTALLWAGFLLGLLVFYLLLNWLPSLVISRGLTRGDASWVQLAFNVGGALGSLATGVLMDRWGRTAAIVLVFSASIASLVLLASVPPELLVMLVAGFCVGAAVSGSQTALYALAPSCYPTAVRGTGVGAAVSAGRLGSVLGPLLAGALIGSGQSAFQVVVTLIPILALSGCAAAFLARRLGSAEREGQAPVARR